MRQLTFQQFVRWGCQVGLSFLGAVTFYTTIPLPTDWKLEFRAIARWAPLIGLMIGGILGLVDTVLQQIGVPILTRSALIIVGWIALTGGLHLDGAMDTADGLAVQDPQRRLEVMVDSATGAFGAMAAVALLLLKTAALTNIESFRGLALIMAAGWGRWGQVAAIAFYPYLKPAGKGAFHKQAIRTPQDVLLGLFLLLGVCGWVIGLDQSSTRIMLGIAVGGCAIALIIGAWFHQQLGGHTGDTYGAVVEWTEALFLCLLTTLLTL